jgi:hypothetical protein
MRSVGICANTLIPTQHERMNLGRYIIKFGGLCAVSRGPVRYIPVVWRSILTKGIQGNFWDSLTHSRGITLCAAAQLEAVQLDLPKGDYGANQIQVGQFSRLIFFIFVPEVKF